MKTIETKVLSDAVNCPIIQIPGRRFPGVVIQGDSLKNLCSLSEEIVRLTQDTASDELHDTASELMDLLLGYVSKYESTLRDCNINLPYPK